MCPMNKFISLFFPAFVCATEFSFSIQWFGSRKSLFFSYCVQHEKYKQFFYTSKVLKWFHQIEQWFFFLYLCFYHSQWFLFDLVSFIEVGCDCDEYLVESITLTLMQFYWTCFWQLKKKNIFIIQRIFGDSMHVQNGKHI